MSHYAEVFISYRASDLALAENVYHRLTDEGLEVWFDTKRLQRGYQWQNEIDAAAVHARVVLPILTPEWKESPWTRFETYGAEHVIPLLCKGDWQEVAPPPLRHVQF